MFSKFASNYLQKLFVFVKFFKNSFNLRKEKSNIPYLISSCVRQVERRGMKEVGIYRVSGLSTDVQKLKKAFETSMLNVLFEFRTISNN